MRRARPRRAGAPIMSACALAIAITTSPSAHAQCGSTLTTQQRERLDSALALGERGDNAGAELALAPLLAEHGEDPDVRMLDATLNARLGALEAASEKFEALAITCPAHTQVWINLVIAKAALTHYDEARATAIARWEATANPRMAALVADIHSTLARSWYRRAAQEAKAQGLPPPVRIARATPESTTRTLTPTPGAAPPPGPIKNALETTTQAAQTPALNPAPTPSATTTMATATATTTAETGNNTPTPADEEAQATSATAAELKSGATSTTPTHLSEQQPTEPTPGNATSALPGTEHATVQRAAVAEDTVIMRTLQREPPPTRVQACASARLAMTNTRSEALDAAQALEHAGAKISAVRPVRVAALTQVLARESRGGEDLARLRASHGAALGEHALVISARHAGRISFGAFAEPANAKRRAATIEALGVTTQSVPLYATRHEVTGIGARCAPAPTPPGSARAQSPPGQLKAP